MTTKVSEQFKQFLKQENLDEFSDEKYYFKQLLQNIMLHRTAEVNEESPTEVRKLQKLLLNPEKAVDTKYDITGFVNSTHLFYNHNLDSNKTRLTVFSIPEPETRPLEYLILLGDIKFKGYMDYKGEVNAEKDPILCGVSKEGFTKDLAKEEPLLTEQYLLDNMMSFLSHYSKITRIKPKINPFLERLVF